MESNLSNLRPFSREWEREVERRFQEGVAREIEAHLKAGRSVYFAEGDDEVELRPDGTKVKVRSLSEARQAVSAKTAAAE